MGAGHTSLSDEDKKKLSWFLIDNDDFEDAAYSELLTSIPYRYNSFPSNVSKSKQEYLSKIGKISLTEDSFNFCSDDDSLKIDLLSTNIDTYFSKKSVGVFEIDDLLKIKLFQSVLSETDKIKIAYDIEPSILINSREATEELATIFSKLEVIPSKLGSEVLKSMILTASTSQIALNLLTKTIDRWDNAGVMELISKLDKPYREISRYGKYPKIPKSGVTRSFLEALKDRGYISSYSEKLLHFRVNTYKSANH